MDGLVGVLDILEKIRDDRRSKMSKKDRDRFDNLKKQGRLVARDGKITVESYLSDYPSQEGHDNLVVLNSRRKKSIFDGKI